MGQRDVGPKISDKVKPKGFTDAELQDIERQLDAMKLKLSDPAAGARPVMLTVLGKPRKVWAIRWDVNARESKKTNEAYFHFDERLGRLELRESRDHGETLWMKKVHKSGELRRAYYSAENFIRTQGLRVVEQRKIEKIGSKIFPKTVSEAVVCRIDTVDTVLNFNVFDARGTLLIQRRLRTEKLDQASIAKRAKNIIVEFKRIASNENWEINDVFADDAARRLIGSVDLLEAAEVAKFVVQQSEPENPSELMAESIESVVTSEIHRVRESLNVQQ